MRYKFAFLKDIFLNLIAAGVSVAVLQLLVYPFISNETNNVIFGQILIIMAIVNIVGVVLGSSLSNIRLKYQNEYKDLSGDYNVLMLGSMVFNVIVVSLLIILLTKVDNLEVDNLEFIIIIILSILTMLRAYLIVEFRIKLSFNKILYHSLFYSIGLIMGLIPLSLSFHWFFPFLIAEIISFFYLIRTTKIINDPLIRTHRYKQTLTSYLYLCISNAIKNTLIYLDRIILYPILGPQQVAIFFIASAMGKMSSFVLSPISSVVLSYLSKEEKRMNIRTFILINIIILVFTGIVSIIAIISSYLILPYLYPKLFDYTVNIIIISNLAAVIRASVIIPQTIILKYSETYNQIILQVIDMVLYVGLGLLFINKWGLVGFCYALLIASIIIYIVTLFLGYKSIITTNQDGELT